MTSLCPPVLSDQELHELLAEDVPFGDLTTKSLGIAGRPGPIRCCARDPMRVCGTEEAVRMFELCGDEAQCLTPSGAEAPPRDAAG